MVTRYAIFGLTILLGLMASLYLGWELRPEAYAADGNLDRAIEHLEYLNPDNVLAPLVTAMEFGQEHNYSEADLNLLTTLASALREQVPSLSHTPTP